eukprot:6479103-Amphidinium_carterae.1
MRNRNLPANPTSTTTVAQIQTATPRNATRQQMEGEKTHGSEKIMPVGKQKTTRMLTTKTATMDHWCY